MKLSKKEIKKKNEDKINEIYKNIEDIYFSKDVCSNFIKKKYYRYGYDEVNKRNKCIELITEECNNYGDITKCSFSEMNEWLKKNEFDINKVYEEDRLEECKNTYEKEIRYS